MNALTHVALAEAIASFVAQAWRQAGRLSRISRNSRLISSSTAVRASGVSAASVSATEGAKFRARSLISPRTTRLVMLFTISITRLPASQWRESRRRPRRSVAQGISGHCWCGFLRRRRWHGRA
ncbi:hypothetical protein D3C78_1365240 [compost metagenome]